MARHVKVVLTNRVAKTSVGEICGQIKDLPGVDKAKNNTNGKGGYHIVALVNTPTALESIKRIKGVKQASY